MSEEKKDYNIAISTKNIKHVGFSVKKSSQKLSQKWKKTVSDISFEDKILLEESRNDFKNGRTVSHKKIMDFLGK